MKKLQKKLSNTKTFSLLLIILFNASDILCQTIEDFNDFNIGSSYLSGIYNGNNIEWKYTNAKGGQKIEDDNSNAICLNKAADAEIIAHISGGCSQITFDYEQEYSSDVDASVYINDSLIAIIKTNQEQDIPKNISINNLSVKGYFTLTIKQNNSNSGHLTIDNIYIMQSIDFSKPAIIVNNYFEIDSIIIVFSKKLIENSVSKMNFYSNQMTINSLNVMENKICLFITNSSCNEIALSVSGIIDIDNHPINDTSLFFSPNHIPQWGDIVITEIMSDPEPAVYLPEIEYIEIYNRSLCFINLNTMRFIQNYDTTYLMEYELNPLQYYILCKNCTSQYSDSINVIDIPSLPLILNDGSKISLINNNSETVCFADIKSEWHDSKFKENGGWSLERIDINNLCAQQNNWKSSESEYGGTPGFANSVFDIITDSINPKIEYSSYSDDSVITLHFNEYVLVNNQKLGYYINDKILTSYINNNPSNEIILQLENSISDYEKYTIKIETEISDCIGNKLTDNLSYFAKGNKAEFNDIVINELLFNPLIDGYDYVEIFNKSNKNILLSDLYFTKKDETGEISDFAVFTKNNQIIFPNEYFVFTENCNYLYENYYIAESINCIENNYLPSLPDDEGNISILSKSNILIDEFTYNEDMHNKLLDDNEGVSLERINYFISTSVADNWQSAAEDVGYGTPGYKNSQFQEIGNMKSGISITPELFSPNGDGYNDRLIISYSFNSTGYNISITVFDSEGRLIKTIAENINIGIEGNFIWDGVSDNNVLVISGIYIILIEGLDETGKQFAEKKVCAVEY